VHTLRDSEFSVACLHNLCNSDTEGKFYFFTDVSNSWVNSVWLSQVLRYL